MTNKYRGQTATVGVGGITVGILQTVEFKVVKEGTELMGQSPKILDRQVDLRAVEVSAELGKFDMSGFGTIAGHDGGSPGAFKVTAAPQVFDVTLDIDKVSGGTDTVKAIDVWFDDITISTDRDSFVTEDITGRGTDLQIP